MSLADQEVGRVVGRGDLEDSRAEGHVDMFVAHDWDSALILGKFRREGS